MEAFIIGVYATLGVVLTLCLVRLGMVLFENWMESLGKWVRKKEREEIEKKKATEKGEKWEVAKQPPPPVQTKEELTFSNCSVEEAIVNAVSFLFQETGEVPDSCRLSVGGFTCLMYAMGQRAVFDAEKKAIRFNTGFGEVYVYADRSCESQNGLLTTKDSITRLKLCA